MIDRLLYYLEIARKRRLIDRLSLFILLISFFILMMTFPALAQESAQAQSLNPQAILRNSLVWVHSLGSAGAIAFIGIYIVATVAFVPGSILTLGAGAVFGVIIGSLYVLVGATLGATAAFLIGRYLARGWVASKIEKNRYFKAIDEAVGRDGFKIVLLTRLSPIIPFFLTNYAYGVTKVSLKDYVLGSVGMVPGTLMYVYIGSLAGHIATIGAETPPINLGVQWTLRIGGLIATIVATVYITQIARKALDEAILK